jgi:hypothetical protein
VAIREGPGKGLVIGLLVVLLLGVVGYIAYTFMGKQ